MRGFRNATGAAALALVIGAGLAAPVGAQSPAQNPAEAPLTPPDLPRDLPPDLPPDLPSDLPPLHPPADTPERADQGAGQEADQNADKDADTDAAPDAVAPDQDTAAANPKEAGPEEERTVEESFQDLQSDDESVWRPAQERITKAWSKSGSDSMDLLLKRGQDAMAREDWDHAVRHLTDLVNLAPEFAEGWHTRATAYFHAGDYGSALSDISQTLALEPRHFGALSGLGLILEELGYEKEAAAAFRRALEVNPHLDAAEEAVKRLAPKVDGRGA